MEKRPRRKPSKTLSLLRAGGPKGCEKKRIRKRGKRKRKKEKEKDKGKKGSKSKLRGEKKKKEKDKKGKTWKNAQDENPQKRHRCLGPVALSDAYQKGCFCKSGLFARIA